LSCSARDGTSSAFRLHLEVRSRTFRLRRQLLAGADNSELLGGSRRRRWIGPLWRLPFARNSSCVRQLSALLLNHMVQYRNAHLDASFAALSDATRRDVLEQLGRADASITELADQFHMTLTGMKKHVSVLEQAGLVTTQKVGRVRTCKLGLRRLEEEAAWIERYRQLWDARFAALDNVVEELKQKEKVHGRKQ